MLAVIKRPGKAALEVVQSDGEYTSIREVVGGFIESVHVPWARHLHFYCHEEGKLEGLPPNFFMPAIGDVIVGSVIFFRSTPDGNEASLTDEDVLTLSSWFHGPNGDVFAREV